MKGRINYVINDDSITVEMESSNPLLKDCVFHDEISNQKCNFNE